MAIDVKPEGYFGTAIFSALEAQGISLNELAIKIEKSYEHMRKLVRGIAYPSKSLLKELSVTLNLKIKDLEDLVSKDKIKKNYGDSASRLFKKNPELETIEKNWAFLSKEQKESINTMIKALSQNNSRSKNA